MSVQTQQFRVVGVNTDTGKDVSIVIDAATKASAEVMAGQMHIETTHIVRIKSDTPLPPDEHALFSHEAAEALAGKRTINLIEEVISPNESRPAPPPMPQPVPRAAPQEPANPIVTALTRPNYGEPVRQQESSNTEVSGLRAFGLVLVVLLGISAGAYFVLIHEPNMLRADNNELIFGHDLFSDVIDSSTMDQSTAAMRDAFNNRSSTSATNTDAATPGPPIAEDQQVLINDANSKAGQRASELQLQSVVTTNQGRFAVINGKLYKQGSKIGSATLVSVADDWVLIERAGKQFTLAIDAKADYK